MKYIFGLLLTCCAWGQVPTGLGYSTYTCLDKDGDGYGVGPGCTGLDSDDTDITVHTAAEGITKYTTLAGFVTHLLGFTPGNLCYISTSGNDSTGACNDASHPFLTLSKIQTLTGNGGIVAGDVVLFRAGTWTGQALTPQTSGTSGHPLVFMAYPGESALLQQTSSNMIFIANLNYITFFGLRLQDLSGGSPDACIAGGSGATSGPITSTGIQLLNMEGIGCKDLIIANGLGSTVIQGNLVRDAPNGEHCFYLGAGGIPAINITITQNICYNMGFNGLHLNGRMTNVMVSQNLIYENAVAAVSFQMGVSDSFLQNNVLIGYDSSAFEISNYDGDCLVGGNICPYDQTGNVIENNTIYQTGYTVAGGGAGHSAVIVANNSTGQVGDLGHNTFRNNILVGVGAGCYPAVAYLDTMKTYLSTSTFANNIFWTTDGGTEAFGFGTSGAPCGFGYVPYTCTTAAALTNLSNCINSDPKFVDVSTTYHATPSNYHFYPAVGSPAQVAGNTSGVPTYDFSGQTRGSPPSIGAYEMLGWFQVPNTKLDDFCTAQGYSGCQSTLAEWGGAAMDTMRHHYILTGGGASATNNGVYSLVITGKPAWSALVAPSTMFVTGCSPYVDINPDGLPRARHTYYNLLYLPLADVMYMFGGRSAIGDCTTFASWALHLSSNTWTALDPVNASGPDPLANVGNAFASVGGFVIAYNPNTGYAWIYVSAIAYNVFSYGYGNGTNTGAGNDIYKQYSGNQFGSGVVGNNAGGAVDPNTNRFWLIGNGAPHIAWVDASGTYPANPTDVLPSAVGCTTMAGLMYPSVNFDTALQKITVYQGWGNTIWIYDQVANTCTSEDFPNGPTNFPAGYSSAEAMSRWQYDSILNAYVYAGNSTDNAFMLRLTPTVNSGGASHGGAILNSGKFQSN